MPAFEYEALDQRGRRAKGMLSADSESAARRELRRRRLAPLKVARADEKGGGARLAGLLDAPKLSNGELMLATRQLSTLIGAGMPVEEALGLVAGQTRGEAARRILVSVRGRVTEGERLSEAMAGHPDSFPGVYRAMIAAGESAGGLPAVLDRLADYLEKSAALRRKIGVALIYPIALALVATTVVVVLMVFIVPRIAEQILSMGMTVPALTRLMIAISGFLQASWVPLLVGALLAVLAFMILSRRPRVKAAIDGALLRTPAVGGLVRKIESARFARTMSILIASGAVLPEALRAARKASGNAPFQAMIGSVIEDVETGGGLADSLRARDGVPPLMVYMVAAGERSGRLDQMFARSAEHLEGEIDAAVTVGLNLLEPGIIIVMGAVVTTIVLSILLPILSLNTAALG